MARLQTWGAAARRSRLFQVVAAVVVLALVAGSIVLVTRSAGPPVPPPPPVERAIALGDSVPYGHGLANPYVTPQIGLPARAVSQGPSTGAYPSMVAADFGLTMTVRPTNCHLTGDQLSISGAVADGVADVVFHLVYGCLIDKGSDGRAGAQTATDDKRTDCSLQLGGERVVNAVFHKDAVGTDACLAAVAEFGDHDPGHSPVEIGVGEDDEGRVSA